MLIIQRISFFASLSPQFVNQFATIYKSEKDLPDNPDDPSFDRSYLKSGLIFTVKFWLTATRKLRVNLRKRDYCCPLYTVSVYPDSILIVMGIRSGKKGTCLHFNSQRIPLFFDFYQRLKESRSIVLRFIVLVSLLLSG